MSEIAQQCPPGHIAAQRQKPGVERQKHPLSNEASGLLQVRTD
jgi:hypothetical protein